MIYVPAQHWLVLVWGHSAITRHLLPGIVHYAETRRQYRPASSRYPAESNTSSLHKYCDHMLNTASYCDSKGASAPNPDYIHVSRRNCLSSPYAQFKASKSCVKLTGRPQNSHPCAPRNLLHHDATFTCTTWYAFLHCSYLPSHTQGSWRCTALPT
jgi:hypothetical protein